MVLHPATSPTTSQAGGCLRLLTASDSVYLFWQRNLTTQVAEQCGQLGMDVALDRAGVGYDVFLSVAGTPCGGPSASTQVLAQVMGCRLGDS